MNCSRIMGIFGLRSVISLAVLSFTLMLHPLPSVWADDSAYRIGLLTDLSGPGAFWGKQSRIGAVMAQKELAAVGIKVEVVFGDSGLDTNRSLSEAQKLLAVDQVDALITEFSPVTNAVAPLVQRSNKLFIGSCAARKFLEKYDAAFKSFLEYEKGCREVAEEFKRKGIGKIGLLKVQTEFGEWCERGLLAVYPHLVVADYVKGEVVASQVLVLQSKGVQALVHTGYEGDALNAFKELARMQWRVPIAGCAPDLFTGKTLQQFPQESEGGIGFGYRPVDSDFIKKVQEEEPNVDLYEIEGAANAYLMVKELARAIAACKKGDLNCQVQALSAAKGSSLLGFNGFRNRIADFDFALYAVKNGKLEAIK